MERARELCELFASEYMGRVFYFCLRRTGDEHEAEDLTSDIALSVVEQLKRGAVLERALDIGYLHDSGERMTGAYLFI